MRITIVDIGNKENAKILLTRELLPDENMLIPERGNDLIGLTNRTVTVQNLIMYYKEGNVVEVVVEVS